MQGHCERCVWGCILVQASGRSWLLRTIFPQMGSRSANSETALMLCAEGLRGVAALLLTAEGCVLAALCARSEGQAARVCGRPAAECARLAAGLCGDGGTALILAAMADARDAALVLAACEKEAGQRDTNGFTALRGCSTEAQVSQPHRGGAGVQRGTAAAHRGVSKRCPGQDSVSL